MKTKAYPVHAHRDLRALHFFSEALVRTFLGAPGYTRTTGECRMAPKLYIKVKG